MPAITQDQPVLFFETHPIQYRAPVFQALQQIAPDRLEVIYASDFSVRGEVDREFGTKVRWDRPLLEGYRYRVLDNERPGGAARFSGLSGAGVDRLIAEKRPSAVVLHSLAYHYNMAAYWAALRRRIPVWYRCDSNETAFARSGWKAAARQVVYRTLYAGLTRGLYVGERNREHFKKFGVPDSKLRHVPHCVPDPLGSISEEARQALRTSARERIGATESDTVFGFFGKLIPKKNPSLLLEALAVAPISGSARCLFVGSGELEQSLRSQADRLHAERAIESHFAGFINQSDIQNYYLATDVLVLPSNHAGETWGLVVNEALNAGCSVALTDSVGCSTDFGHLARVRVSPTGDAEGLARSLAELAGYPRDLDWARPFMRGYSVEAAATALLELMEELDRR